MFGSEAVVPLLQKLEKCLYWLLLSMASLCSNAQAQPGQWVDVVPIQVCDQSGAYISGATVTVKRQDAPTEILPITVSADDQGRATLRLAPGSYVLTARSQGFESLDSAVVVVAHEKHVELRFVLRLPAVQEHIDVLGNDGQDENQATILKDGQIRGLSDDPKIMQLQLKAMMNQVGGGPLQFSIDGFIGGRLPPKSTIQTIRLNQNGFSAQYDVRGSALVEITTKPGTEVWHGSATSDGTSSVWNAKNPYAVDPPPYHGYAYDGDLSGSIGKRTSLFLNANQTLKQSSAIVNATALDASLTQLNVTQAVPQSAKITSFGLRLDRLVSSNDNVTLRYRYDEDARVNDNVGLLVLSSQGGTVLTKLHTVQLGNTGTWGKKIAQDFRLQFIQGHTERIPTTSLPTLIVEGAFNGGGDPEGGLRDDQSRLELQQNLSLEVGKHILRSGWRYRTLIRSNTSQSGFNGEFIFQSLAAYRLTLLGIAAGQSASQIRTAGGGSSQFSLTTGNPTVSITTSDVGAYVEDSWRVNKKFSVVTGLRIESQSSTPDRFDPAPRMNLVWVVQPPKMTAPLFTVRLGSGLFYQRFPEDNILAAKRQNGITQIGKFFNDPDFYPSLPSSADLAQTQSTIYQLASNLHTAYSIYNVASLSRTWNSVGTVTVAVTNERGNHQYLSRRVDSPTTATAAAYQYSSDGVAKTETLAVNYNLHVIPMTSLWGGWALQWQKANAFGPNSFDSDSRNLSSDYGRPPNSTRNRVFLGSSSDLGHGLTLSALLTAHSSTRFNITTGTDLNGDTIYNDRPSFATDLSRASVVKTAFGNFDVLPLPGQKVIPVNYGRAPGLFAVDLQLGKSFNFGPVKMSVDDSSEARNGQGNRHFETRPYECDLSIQTQNIFNRVNPGQPIGVLSSPQFGQSIALNPDTIVNNSANRVVTLSGSIRF